MPTQQDTKNRISSVKNIQKITKAMEMVAAARLRRAEQRIEAMRPYAEAIRRMTGRVVEAVERIPDLPLLEEHDETRRVGLLLVTGDRGLAGPFNSQIIRAGNRRETELKREGKEVVWYASGKRGISSLSFRGHDVVIARQGYTDRPAYSNARDLANDIATQYEEGNVDRVEMIFNHYESAMSQEVQRDVLLPLQQIEALVTDEEGRTRARTRRSKSAAACGSTSPIPRRCSSAWCPTTSRSRYTAPCWSQPPPSTARA